MKDEDPAVYATWKGEIKVASTLPIFLTTLEKENESWYCGKNDEYRK